MGLELTTDRYPSITSQTRYPLRHAVDVIVVVVGGGGGVIVFVVLV